MAELDKLTGFFTQKYFLERLEEEVLRTKRYELDLSLLLVDVNYNHFDKTSDIKANLSYGVLKQLALLFKKVLRAVDLVGRYDGDTMIVMLPETNEDKAKVTAERLRNTVEANEFRGEESKPSFHIAVTIGIACFFKHANSAKELLEASQKGLKQAVSKGNNCVEVSPSVIQGSSSN